MRTKPHPQNTDKRTPLPRGEALLVGAIALLISGTILFFAVSTSRPSESSRTRASYEKPIEMAPQLGATEPNPTQLSQKEKLQ